MVESDVFRRELINRQRSEELYRKIDANARIQKALAQQAHGYLDHKYSAGDMIIFKEDGKNRWTGPAKVTGTENSKVRIIHAGYDRTVPACRVLPFKEEKHEDESEEQTDGDANDKKHEDVDESEKQTDNNETDKRTSTNINSEVDANDNGETNREVRPRLYKEIMFKTSNETMWKKGKTVKVGKRGGNNKFRVWIKSTDGIETNYDFPKDIVNWKYLDELPVDKVVRFVKTTKDNHDSETSSKLPIENESTGVWFLQNKDFIDEEQLEVDFNDVLVTQILVKFHTGPAVVQAKADELEKWKKFEAYEEVEMEDQHILSTRWVVVKKDETRKIKARLCVRGFEEFVHP